MQKHNLKYSSEEERKEARRLQGKALYDKNPEKSREKGRLQAKKYAKKIAARQLKKYRERVECKIRAVVGNRIRKCLKRESLKKNKSTINYLGCNFEFYKNFLADKFKEGMCWENHGKVWHIDHILPISSFDFNVEENIYKAFHYTNTQPLFIHENLKKSNKIC